MSTEITIDGTSFLINGQTTYEKRSYQGYSIEGRLFNSRMIQALFDDECLETRKLWRYPDTGAWDPDRNTNEFCAQLSLYRAHGLLAVTVGLQGGGSIYSDGVYDKYINSAYEPDGSFKKPYFDRLLRILSAADDAGMVVIVNYFYGRQVKRIPDDATIYNIAERVTDWLLRTGYCNILVDVANEAGDWWGREPFMKANVHKLIDVVQNTTLNGRRLLVGVSSSGGQEIATGAWLAKEDFSMPHGNGLTPDELKKKLRMLRDQPEYKTRPRPLLINEDSIFVENLEAAVEAGASWGFYCQGYGSDYQDRMNWKTKPRESRYEELSGYQTVPVNWGINTDIKRTFFDRLRTITGGQT